MAAVILLAADALFIGWRYSLQAETGWLVRMPALERYQIEHPDNALTNSESWDPRLPPGSVIDPAFDPKRADMMRDILGCRPGRVVIDGQLGAAPQMPNRFYVYGERQQTELPDCARAKLPAGYTIEPIGERT